MKRLTPQPNWPDSWRVSHGYDLLEIHGEKPRSGYARAYENRRHHALSMVREAVPAGARVLDVAAAQGNFTLALAEMDYHVTWNDLRAELADFVRLKHESGSVEFAPGNIFDLQVSCPFDAILMTEVIEHVAHPDEFLVKAAELLAPGGCIILTTPNGAYFRNKLPRFSDCLDPSAFETVQFKPDSDGHIFLLHPEELDQLATSAGLKMERLTLFTSPLTNGHFKTEPFLQFLPQAIIRGLEHSIQKFPKTVKQRLLIQMAARLRKPA
jgi:2-polyprenyl-6-hydroxyphenyl methylase/3-demethylubiquinone-9 3-methyltransferase